MGLALGIPTQRRCIIRGVMSANVTSESGSPAQLARCACWHAAYRQLRWRCRAMLCPSVFQRGLMPMLNPPPWLCKPGCTGICPRKQAGGRYLLLSCWSAWLLSAFSLSPVAHCLFLPVSTMPSMPGQVLAGQPSPSCHITDMPSSWSASTVPVARHQQSCINKPCKQTRPRQRSCTARACLSTPLPPPTCKRSLPSIS